MGSFLFYAGATGFAFGIFSRTFLDFGLPEIVWLLVISFALALIGRRGNKASTVPYMLCMSLFVCLFALGALRLEWATWDESQPALEAKLDAKITIEGVVVREPDRRENTTHVYVQQSDELLLVTTDPASEVQYGDHISATGVLQKPESFETDLGRTFNYQGYLQARGVNYVLSFAEIKTVETLKGNKVIGVLLEFKHAFMRNVEAVIPQPHAGLSEGLLLGVKQALGEDLETAFRKAGIMHIVVLSGYNIMLVIVFVMYVLALVLPLRARLVVGLVAVVLFACLVGFSATVVRASVMAALALFAKFTGRTYAVVRALVFTGVVMLLLNPYLLVYDVGFQLSFIATLGLILVAPHLERYVRFMPKTIGLREFLTATLATQLFVLPLLLYQIGEFSVVAVAVNVLVLPMVPVAMLLTFTTGMLGFVSATLSLPFAYLSYVSLQYIIGMTNFFASLPFAAFTIPAFSFYFVIIGYAGLSILLWRLYTKRSVHGVTVHGLSKWVIVEEESIVAEQKAAQSNDPAATPVFFR